MKNNSHNPEEHNHHDHENTCCDHDSCACESGLLENIEEKEA